MHAPRPLAIVLLAAVIYTIAAHPSNLGDIHIASQANSPTKYILAVHPATPLATIQSHLTISISAASLGGENPVNKVLDGQAFRGMAVTLTPSQLADLQAKYPDAIVSAERDSPIHATATLTQSNAAPTYWGLARISQTTADRTSNDFLYPEEAGTGVYVYLIDSGIRLSHNEFATDRAKFLVNLVTGEDNTDLNGHGTHGAGTILGTTAGVAKKATVWSIKVLDKTGSGSASSLIDALNQAVAHAVSNSKINKAVINLSLGGEKSAAIDAAVLAAYTAGIPIFSAAGNEGQDSCTTSPAGSAGAFAVGAVSEETVGTSTHVIAPTWTAYGTCVRIHAPGNAINSAWNTTDTAAQLLSGTSVSTNFVTGVAAQFMSQKAYTKPVQVYWDLRKWAARNIIQSGLKYYTPNAVLFNRAGLTP